MKEDLIKVKITETYANQFVTTLKGYVFYKDKSTDYFGDDNEVESLLSQGILEAEGQKEFEEAKNKELVKEEKIIIEEKPIEIKTETPPKIQAETPKVEEKTQNASSEATKPE